MSELRKGLEAAIRAAKLALFVIKKQNVMPNSSWETEFESDLETAEAALAATHDSSNALTGAALGRWCYENPNLAALTIEGLRASDGTQGALALYLNEVQPVEGRVQINISIDELKVLRHLTAAGADKSLDICLETYGLDYMQRRHVLEKVNAKIIAAQPAVGGEIVCHASGDRCLGCQHYQGKADQCEFAALAATPAVINECVCLNECLALAKETAATPAVGGEAAAELVQRFEMESMALHKTQRDWLVREIGAALHAQPASPLRGRDWQPMSTAPKDAEIIGQDPDGRIFNLRWEPDDCGENWYDVHGDQLAYPVRWMPMPSASPPEQPAAAPVTPTNLRQALIDEAKLRGAAISDRLEIANRIKSEGGIAIVHASAYKDESDRIRKVIVDALEQPDPAEKLACRRCGGWRTIRLGNGNREICDLCHGTGNEPAGNYGETGV